MSDDVRFKVSDSEAKLLSEFESQFNDMAVNVLHMDDLRPRFRLSFASMLLNFADTLTFGFVKDESGKD